jgi:FixJ family two-component response regulator
MISQHDSQATLCNDVTPACHIRRVPSAAFQLASLGGLGGVSDIDPTVLPPGRIVVVDEDLGTRESFARLFARVGRDCAGFSAGAEFLADGQGTEPTCAILGFHLADGTGLEFQRTLSKERTATSVIFQTAGNPVEAAVHAMKAGALDILTKPFRDDAVLAAIGPALERSRMLIEDAKHLRVLADRHASLTLRERQIFVLVASGLMNKQVAFALGLSEITVKAHRGRVMRKMQARSLPDLVIMAGRLGLNQADPVVTMP